MSHRAELSSELISTIEAETRRAHFPEIVARKLGVHKKLWQQWMKEGEQAHLDDTDSGPRDEFFMQRQLFERIEEAEAYAEMELLNMAREQAEMGKTSWNGFLTTLERRFGDRWRKRDAAASDMNDNWEAQLRKHMMASREAATEKLRSVK